MRNKIIFALSVIGAIAGLISAYIYGVHQKPQPPLFKPASNPYPKGIYANGIIESYQSNGENINIFPEVSGTVSKIMVAEGETVRKGTPLLMIDDSVQRAAVDQNRSQARAAQALLEELKAQPRKENLEVAKAQVELASSTLKNAQDQLDKQAKAYELDPRGVSREVLDTATNAVSSAKANLEVTRKQYELVKAGAWVYEIRNQENQYDASLKALAVAQIQLARYVIKAPIDGTILSVNASVGSYISAQGTYGTYTQGFKPVMVMGGPQTIIGVRCYIDEILIHRLPQPNKMSAQMSIRGTDIRIPLEYVRTQPYVSPKVELSNQRAERVDVRVLPVIFRFERPKDINIYPGQLVDVYIGEK